MGSDPNMTYLQWALLEMVRGATLPPEYTFLIDNMDSGSYPQGSGTDWQVLP